MNMNILRQSVGSFGALAFTKQDFETTEKINNLDKKIEMLRRKNAAQRGMPKEKFQAEVDDLSLELYKIIKETEWV